MTRREPFSDEDEEKVGIERASVADLRERIHALEERIEELEARVDLHDELFRAVIAHSAGKRLEDLQSVQEQRDGNADVNRGP